MPTTLERPRTKTQKLHLKRSAAKASVLTGRKITAPPASGSMTLTSANQIRDQIAILQKQLGTLQVAEAPKVILPELHDEKSGRIDAQKLADFMAIPLKRLAEGVELNYKAVHRDPSGDSFQEALRPVKRSLEYLHELFQKPAIIRVWLNTPHPMLDGQTALATILQGKAFAIERLLGNAWDGVVS
jgi:Protein of unknown function (DUF2384)